jgi:hypothetical protein
VAFSASRLLLRVLTCAIAACLAAGRPALAEPVFLVVAASGGEPGAVARQARQIAAAHLGSLVVSTADCGERHRAFAVVTAITGSTAEARAAREQLRTAAKDAYVKRCEVIPGSPLALRIPAIDPSIADIPKDAINWSDEDKLTSSQRLSNDAWLVTVGYYIAEPDDPLEGRRRRIVLATANGDRTILAQDCPNIGRPAALGGLLAFDCAREQAGKHLLHAVLAFNQGMPIGGEIERCREPKWTGIRQLTCRAESVRPNGELVLTPKRIRLDGR